MSRSLPRSPHHLGIIREAGCKLPAAMNIETKNI